MEIERSRSMWYLREITTKKSSRALAKTPETFAAACLIASFLLAQLPHEAPQRSLFDITSRALEALPAHTDLARFLQTYFLKIMRTMGHLPETLPKNGAQRALWITLQNASPQFVLTARRTLGIFSKFESTRSS